MLGKYLKEFRLRHNWSQVRMAKHLGLPQYHYSLIETGKMKPGYIVTKRIADHLNLPETFVRKLIDDNE